MRTGTEVREAFWRNLSLPPGLTLSREQTIALPRRGPGGHALVDLARLESSIGRSRFVLLARPRVLAPDVTGIRDLLHRAADAIATRSRATADMDARRPQIGVIT